MIDEKLLSKYDIPTPRYTSYPIVPYWQTEPILENVWKDRLMDLFLNKYLENLMKINEPC